MFNLVLDIETAPLPNVEAFLDPVEASKNLKDPEKIKADLERRRQDQLSDCGLDWNLNRIVCVGLQGDHDAEPAVLVAGDEQAERALLIKISSRLSNREQRPSIVGFCVRRFDVPVILQRARYLDVPMPRISLKRWDNPHIIDLYDVLTFDDQPCTSVMRRTLNSFCRRFGIDVPDETNGKDIDAMVKAGEWDAIAKHCRADVHKTRLLAERLGVLASVAEVV